MEYSTPLAKLPAGLAFPPDLSDRILFDAERRLLIFRGFMSKYAHDELVDLAEDEHYRGAVENLFVLSAKELAPPTTRSASPWTWAAAAVGSTAIAALAAWAVFRTSFDGSAQPSAVPPSTHVAGN